MHEINARTPCQYWYSWELKKRKTIMKKRILKWSHNGCSVTESASILSSLIVAFEWRKLWPFFWPQFRAQSYIIFALSLFRFKNRVPIATLHSLISEKTRHYQHEILLALAFCYFATYCNSFFLQFLLQNLSLDYASALWKSELKQLNHVLVWS